ncbi:hypothetical protein [Plantactinospora sp. KLBMP9567]|uniref:hypothetical protein n=1 Tax=Plantactinospora sp. KLBMP9567 TaxID=3085900 RepID=UPI002981C454|nr:hypothetical protein [Plantactinospora sp. KLBMP9567]MDW5322430.1 hypothetical protein [Plantactinospora sp. KLBMP9567]
MAERDGLAVSYVFLRPDLHTTLSRAQARSGEELKDAEAVTGLHGAFAQLGVLEDHVVDSTGLDAVQTVAEVRRLLASGKYRLLIRDDNAAT